MNKLDFADYLTEEEMERLEKTFKVRPSKMMYENKNVEKIEEVNRWKLERDKAHHDDEGKIWIYRVERITYNIFTTQGIMTKSRIVHSWIPEKNNVNNGSD